MLIHLTNRGPAACRTGGYPGVAVLSENGRQVFQAARTPRGSAGGLPSSTNQWPEVTLRAGQEATAVLEGPDHPRSGGSACPQYAELLVTPPDTTVSVRVRATTLACEAPEVQPLLPGDSGSSG